MKPSWIVPALACLACSGAVSNESSAGLLTVDEAIEISARTGRPIFAVAGDAG